MGNQIYFKIAGYVASNFPNFNTFCPLFKKLEEIALLSFISKTIRDKC
jgi:hypothetical protein